MVLTGTLLAVLAIVLAWPVPLLFARRTTTIDPVSHLATWQAIGLAGGLSLIGTAVVFATAPFAGTLGTGLAGLADTRVLSVLAWWQWGLLLIAVLLSLRLIGGLIMQSIVVMRHRRKHAELVSLLTEPSADLPGTRVLPSDDPIAYCLPGRGSGTTIISTGLLEVLDAEQRNAVVAHERAHLVYHHDLLTLPFASWNRALPFVPATSTALGAVSALIEFMADDHARRTVRPEALAEAIDRTATIYAAGKHSTVLSEARRARLLAPLPRARRRVRLLNIVASVALILVPTLLLACLPLTD